MEQGTVKWFNNGKGFGFIKPEDGEKDLFVHFKNIEGEGFKSLVAGETVEFERQKVEKGWQAIKVKKII